MQNTRNPRFSETEVLLYFSLCSPDGTVVVEFLSLHWFFPTLPRGLQETAFRILFLLSCGFPGPLCPSLLVTVSGAADAVPGFHPLDRAQRGASSFAAELLLSPAVSPASPTLSSHAYSLGDFARELNPGNTCSPFLLLRSSLLLGRPIYQCFPGSPVG